MSDKQDNMAIWNSVKQPPEDALKAITGGRLSGKTDINPQWRMEAMTELFGLVGTGWGYTIERVWTEPGAVGEVFAFALIDLWYIKDGEHSKPVPGIGGSMLIQGEKAGLHNNDEAFKMAVTDALSVALKSLGVGADIYRGRWDGSKYKDGDTKQPERKEPENKEYKFKPPSQNRKTIEERKADAKRFLADNLKHLVLGKEEYFTKKIEECTEHGQLAAVAVEMKTAIEKDTQEVLY